MWNVPADVRIFTNERTLSDIARGTFDPSCPAEGHIFLWTGDDAAFTALVAALSDDASLLDIRAQASQV